MSDLDGDEGPAGQGFLGLASSPYETSTVSLSVRQSVTKVLILPAIRFF